MKRVLLCTCLTCGKWFKLEANYLIEGVEGFMNLKEGIVRILDPTRTRRMCDDCATIELAKLMVDDGSVAEWVK